MPLSIDPFIHQEFSVSTFHAVVWLDHQEAHLAFFDRDHVASQRIHSKSHHKHQGKTTDMNAFFADIAKAVKACREVLLTGPGITQQQFKDWTTQHAAPLSKIFVDSIVSDHPSDAPLVALARQYFKKFDAMAADPTRI
jgi:stalled ribosome rescue protein Dom34